MALMAGYLGFAVSAGVILYGFFIGAILAFLKMLVYRNLYQRLNYFFAYIRRLFQTREAVPYYQASRDGKEAVIPLGLCLLGGCVWYVVRGILC
jgi:prepilin peptidase CpaA